MPEAEKIVDFEVPKGTVVYRGGERYEAGTKAPVPESHLKDLAKIKPLADHPMKRSGPTSAELAAAKLQDAEKASAVAAAKPDAPAEPAPIAKAEPASAAKPDAKSAA
jgi:hypothetical protein